MRGTDASPRARRGRGALLALALMAGAAAAPAPVLRPLPFFYDLYTFRGEGGATTVVAAFAVPVDGLEKEDGDDEVRYRFDVSLILSDPEHRTVTRTDDSVYVGLARPLAGEHLLHTHIQVEARPSERTVHRAIMTDATTPGRGQLHEAPFRIPDYRGSRLMLSDVALGQPDATAGWRRGDVTLALLPTSQLPESAFDVYYEVYNLPAGSRYVTEISIEEVGAQGRDAPDAGRAVQARFTGEAASDEAGVLPELRRVETTLPRGSYRLTVRVTNEDDGATATRSRPFQVRGWGKGATLVQALPRRTGIATETPRN